MSHSIIDLENCPTSIIGPDVKIDLSPDTQFLADIQERAHALLTNRSFISEVVAKICAQVIDEENDADEETINYTIESISKLHVDIHMCGLHQLSDYMETELHASSKHHATIHVNGEWNYHASKYASNRVIYLKHLTLGTVKLLHEYMHSLTPSFLNYYSMKLPDNPPLTETPPRMGTRCIRGSTPLQGDMGFAMEETLLGYGRRLYHTAVTKSEKLPLFSFTHLHCESLDLYNEDHRWKRRKPEIINFDNDEYCRLYESAQYLHETIDMKQLQPVVVSCASKRNSSSPFKPPNVKRKLLSSPISGQDEPSDSEDLTDEGEMESNRLLPINWRS